MNLAQLRFFYFLTYLLACGLISRLLPAVAYADARMLAFSVLTVAAYAAIYLFPLYWLSRLVFKLTG
ncbi:MAG TPA: hypothetical protein VFM46_01725, partial [Pseudomonadales bacterium]|nr:hypothetical protein [Pseudomonadales bacterium]